MSLSTRKRSATSQEEPAGKKLKKVQEEEKALTDAIVHLRRVYDTAHRFCNALDEESLSLSVQIAVTVDAWMSTVIRAEKRSINLQMFPKAHPNRRIPSHYDGLTPATQELLGKSTETIAETGNSAWDDLVAVLNGILNNRLAPSSFCEAKGWSEEQKRHDDLLCMRPSDRTSSLPIVCLHPSFAFFVAELSRQLSPTEDDTALALKAARVLLREMAGSFPEEKSRSRAFNRITTAFWGSKFWSAQQHIQTSDGRRFCFVDFTAQGRRILSIIREDRLELGENGDAFLQAAMVYHLYIHSNKVDDDDRKHGVPTFIICLSGPLLTVGGAFYNGRSCIVEPLTDVRLLHVAVNQEDSVARLLVALKHAVANLDTVDPIPQVAEDIPHAYPSHFTLFDGNQATLTIEKFLPLQPGLRRFRSFFEGTLRVNSATPALSVFVKMAPKNYGTEVQQVLATSELAPQLHGKCELDGLPTLYVMERLGSEWCTLFDLPSCISNIGQHEPSFRGAINKVLGVLEEHQLVHGDLRPNNVMVYCDNSGVKLKVIDFDWSGRAGQVRYPADRNEVSITWPAAHGTPINQDHDRVMVASWWLEVFGVEW